MKKMVFIILLIFTVTNVAIHAKDKHEGLAVAAKGIASKKKTLKQKIVSKIIKRKIKKLQAKKQKIYKTLDWSYEIMDFVKLLLICAAISTCLYFLGLLINLTVAIVLASLPIAFFIFAFVVICFC